MEDKKTKLLISVLFSVMILGLLCWSTHSNLFVKNTCCLWVLAGIYLTAFGYFMIWGYCLNVSRANGIVKTVVHKIVSIIICIIIFIVFPIKYGDVLTQNYCEKMILMSENVRIIPLPNINEKSTAAEVWVDKVLIDDREIYPELTEGWEILDGNIYASDVRIAQPLIIKVPEGSYYQIDFIKTEASGMIEYLVEDHSLVVDLYSENRVNANIQPEEIWGRITEAPVIERIFYYGAYFILLWALIDTIWIGVYEHFIKRSEIDNDINKKDVKK